jgi:hypothetical protein
LKGLDNMSIREFHLGDILSITTRHLVSLRMMDGVYDVLDFMTGQSLMTHQLPRASDVCRPELLKQFPQLNDVDASGVTAKNWEKWLNEQVKAYGEKLMVSSLPEGAYQVQDPINELLDMMEPKS